MTRLAVALSAALLAACASPPAPKDASAAAPAADPRCAHLAEIAARMDGQVPPRPVTAVPAASAPVVTGRAAARACPR